MPFRATHRHVRRTVLSIVLFALALVQTLGAVHRVVHPATGVQGGAVSAATLSGEGTSWLQALFKGHAGEHRCDFYDQSSHADVLLQPAAEAGFGVGGGGVEGLLPASRHATAALTVRARGPPSRS